MKKFEAIVQSKSEPSINNLWLKDNKMWFFEGGWKTIGTDMKEVKALIGASNGIAPLDENSKVPAAYLPSYVDDVVEYSTKSQFPAIGESGKIYVALDTSSSYRWSGSTYIEMPKLLELGELASNAYPGNKGKANADAIKNKVDKVSGKQLSTNDFTDDLKEKLDNLDLTLELSLKSVILGPTYDLGADITGWGTYEFTDSNTISIPISVKKEDLGIISYISFGLYWYCPDRASYVDIEISLPNGTIIYLVSTTRLNESYEYINLPYYPDGEIYNYVKDMDSETLNLEMSLTVEYPYKGISCEIDELNILSNDLYYHQLILDIIYNMDYRFIPSGGSKNQILAWKSGGEAKWENLSNIIQSPEEIFAYGVEWKDSVTDPHLTRIGNSTLHKTLPIQSLLKGCIALGKKIMYYLDENDWRFRADHLSYNVDLSSNYRTFEVSDISRLSVGQWIKGDSYKGQITAIDNTASTITVDWGTIESSTDIANLLNIRTIEIGSRLDGYDGTVRVYCPEFWIKSTEDNGTNRVWISTMKIDDSWTHQPACLIDAYKSTVLNTVPKNMGYLSTLPVNSAVSIANTATYCRGGSNDPTNDTYLTTDKFRTNLGKPKTTLSRANMRTYSRNAGSELMSYRQYKNILYWLYVIEYANFNSQETFNSTLTSEGYHKGGMGAGITAMQNWSRYNSYQPICPNGFLNELGNGTGIKSFTIPSFTFDNDGVETTLAALTLTAFKWRGFENTFGDILINVDGIIIDADADNHPNNMNYVYTTDDPTKYGDTTDDIANMEFSGYEIHTEGYTKKFHLGNQANIIPLVMGGNATQGMCDRHYVGDKNKTLRTLLLGDAAYHDNGAGLSCFHSYYSVDYVEVHTGFRSVLVL